MRKSLAILLAAVLWMLCGAGCGAEDERNTLLPGAEGITGISVSTMPQSFEASFTGENAGKLAEYILNMDVQAEFPEDPDVYTGMTWVLDITYDTGDTATVYLFGGLFIRTGEGPWQKVTQEEAQGLEDLLKELQ